MDKNIQYQACFNDNRFDNRRNMSAFYLTIPDDPRYTQALTHITLIRIFYLLCPEFFSAKVSPIGFSPFNSGEELYKAICNGIKQGKSLYKLDNP